MKYLRILCFAVLGVLVAACSGNDATDGGDNGKNVTHEPITVKINLSTSATSGRASTAGGWAGAAVNGEKMKNWFVIIAQGGTIKNIITSQKASKGYPLIEEQYSDVTFEAEGSYDFYSFANIDQSAIGTMTVGGGLPNGLSDGTKPFTVAGNGFDISKNFIPMSNKQTFDISSSTTSVDLWVVRMLAKVELQITNSTGFDLTLNSITLSDLTKNVDENLKLLPSPIDKGEKGECSPNLGKVNMDDYTFGTEAMPYFVSTASTTKATDEDARTYEKQTSPLAIAKDGKCNVVFYVNESAKPTNNHGLFILSLETSNVQSNATNTDATKRYALITTKMDEKGGTWDGEIARNDYHIIPITLDDYEFRLDIYQSEGIGVLPYWVYSDGIYTCTFYNGEEHFHITPLIKRISDGVELQYSSTSAAGTWTVDEAGSTEGLPNCWQVVGTENTDIFASETTATHDYDNGGCPRWSSTDHFVFGKFAAQDKTGMSTYKMTVKVNRDGTSPSPAQRQYTYQLCIVRDNLSSSAVSNAKPLTRSRSCLFGYGRAISE